MASVQSPLSTLITLFKSRGKPLGERVLPDEAISTLGLKCAHRWGSVRPHQGCGAQPERSWDGPL